ncbi:3-hydroxybutyryl-CoA dehydrogenase [Metapseudomonas furukawaii]|uniref:3-hydroxybutyryl-CoA dehydrogenase n=1 Tax=Metapseudomonas furukawaii TaxID=1149133 RepID=UPI00227AFFD2|nr:3-hydroxybutyryl-CoA dehydrogenase [Pseudomonas furukawaii]WAG76525.1 3-hydroxybutyryl-CoA dehydrogenase [Pseudomonas furukawaii]
MTLNKIGVIGAGTMGSGIAQVCASAGLHVTLIDVTESALTRGVAAVDEGLQRQVRKARICEGEHKTILAQLHASTDYSSLGDADLVIEAATENLELKLRILRQIEAVVSADAVIATNTSSISITQLAAVLESPERFIGVHFFNPVPAMQLLELIRGLQTSSQTHAAVESFAKAVGKTPITVDNAPGFVVNRILIPMINEAVFVLQEGLASARDIDTGMQLGCNHPIGPLALADLIGLDTLLAIMQVLHEGFGDPKYRPARLLKDLVAAGHLGRKSGRGFHSY